MKTKHILLICRLVIAAVPAGAVMAAPGDVDLSFNPALIAGSFSPYVQCLAVQGDGKVVVGGNFETVNGSPRRHIVRLNADGSFDSSFNPGFGPSANVWCVALQHGVLVGGPFPNFNSSTHWRIARLGSDGRLDNSFDPQADSTVRAIAVQPNGNIILGGQFSSVSDTYRNGVVRLNGADGSVDTSFNPGEGANDWVYSVAVQPDGKVIVAGKFTTMNEVGFNRIARLNANGTVDDTFNPGSGANDLIYTIALQPDGKILLGGAFTSFNGVERRYVTRLNANGSLDPGFIANADNVPVSIALEANGKILLGGLFTEISGVSRRYLARLNSNGSLDTAFNPPGGADNAVYSVAVQNDGKIMVGGWFRNIGGVARTFVARLHGDGNPSLSPIPLFAQKVANNLVLNWSDSRFILQSALSVSGPYTDVSSATSPHTNAISDPRRFFRLVAE